MYSEKFEKAFEYMLKNEGEYANDPSDLGGATKYGISQRAYPKLDIKNLKIDDAKKIYYCDYWLKGRCDEIKNEVIAAKFFDLVVNVGIKTATRLIQRALRSVDSYVIEDGILGPKTLGAINDLVRPSLLLVALKSEAAGYYRLIAQKSPTQQRFLNGWLNRAYKHINA